MGVLFVVLRREASAYGSAWSGAVRADPHATPLVSFPPTRWGAPMRAFAPKTATRAVDPSGVNAGLGRRRATDSVVGVPIPVGAAPSDVIVTSDGSRAYVTNTYANPGSVSVIDVATRTSVGTITL